MAMAHADMRTCMSASYGHGSASGSRCIPGAGAAVRPGGCGASALQLHAQLAAVRRELEQLQHNMTVGVLGGSVSVGETVPSKLRYSDLLARSPRLTVHNRAVRATGSAFASYCVDLLLPETELDVLVLEYAANDGYLRETHLDYSAASDERPLGQGTGYSLQAHQPLSPLVSSERLIRRSLQRWPTAHIILVNVCPPTVHTPTDASSFNPHPLTPSPLIPLLPKPLLPNPLLPKP